MKKASMKRQTDDLRPEYDLRALKDIVRGANLVLLEPDVARGFPDSESVNRAPRLLRDVATNSARRARKVANGRRSSARR